jgi:PhzF family phenazine biosynthesis protein
LSALDPDDGAVERLADEHDAVGVYAFTFDALDADSTLHARAFAPGAGVPEDPVTGTASGACGSYLRRQGAVDPGELRFEQGHFVDRPGYVRVEADGIAPPRVGGDAVTALDGTITVPDDDSDEIIEA